MSKKFLIAAMGSNLLEIHTAIQHAKAAEAFDDILFVHDGEQDVQPFKRLAENCDASLWTIQNQKMRSTGSNFRVAEKPIDIQADDRIRLDYTGNNKYLSTEIAAQLADAQKEHRFLCYHTYLQTEGQTIPTVQSTGRSSVVYDARRAINPLDPFTLNNLLFGTSNKNGNTPSTFEHRKRRITRHDFIEFLPRKHSDSRWQFEHLLQIGAHQLIFFIKPKAQGADDLSLELMQLYNRMNRIGGYSARGVLLCEHNLDNRRQYKDGLSIREIDDIIDDVVQLCETDTEKATKTRIDSSFDRFDHKWNVSSRSSRLMRPRVEVWGCERWTDADIFQQQLEYYLDVLIR